MIDPSPQGCAPSPKGETWARNSAGIASPALRLAKTASPSFNVFQ